MGQRLAENVGNKTREHRTVVLYQCTMVWGQNVQHLWENDVSNQHDQKNQFVWQRLSATIVGKDRRVHIGNVDQSKPKKQYQNGKESEAEVPLKDSIVLKAGASREVVVEVLEDVVAVRWTVTATVRDIRFGVVFYRASSGGGGGGGGGEEKGNKEDTNQVGTTKDAIVAEQVLSNKEGQITGEYVVAPPGATGLMVFELSNKHSWMRQNGVEYAIEVIQRTHDTEEQTLSLNL